MTSAPLIRRNGKWERFFPIFPRRLRDGRDAWFRLIARRMVVEMPAMPNVPFTADTLDAWIKQHRYSYEYDEVLIAALENDHGD